MKKFILLLTFMLLPACAQQEPPTPFICIHPAIMNGTPFPLPLNAIFDTKGGLHFPSPTGDKITLVGTVCIRVKR